MKILLVYPQYPDTFWSFKHALKFVLEKATNPPLGLLTIAALLPKEWKTKLVDMNTAPLKNRDILWADYIFLSAMKVQIESVKKIAQRCKSYDKKIVAGGPLFTEEPEIFPEIDHLVLNEAEITLPAFLEDLNTGFAKRIYQTKEYAELKDSPAPVFSLVNKSKYDSMCIQYSRGCPFNCEFCDITALLGKKVRTKSTSQILLELEGIYQTGWRKSIFFVDDNFIGNKKTLKEDLLPAMIRWMKDKKHPFSFTTEVSINLADDDELMSLMGQAGFANVFVGVETPNEASLAECGKMQNRNRDILKSIRKIQDNKLVVSAGFIVGFDNDSPSVFQSQIDFIQESGIIAAMVGLLNAPRKTKLYARLSREGRITEEFGGDNTNYSLNFIPKMDKEELLTGYRKIIHGIYSSKPYNQRVKKFMKHFKPNTRHREKITFAMIFALLRSVILIGVVDRDRKYYWQLFFWSIFHRPGQFSTAITYSIYGYHFRKVFNLNY